MTKKEIEQQHFERLCRAKPNLGLELIDQPDPPAPDLIARSEHRRLGIEVTTYYSTPDSVRREAEEANIVEGAKACYNALSLPPVRVTVGWMSDLARSKRDRTKLAQVLARTVAANVPLAGAWLDLKWENLPDELRHIVNHLRISRLGDDCWQPTRVGWIQEFDAAKIQELVDVKNGKLSGYRAYCSDIWLLIGCDSRSPASRAELTESFRRTRFRSGFDRIFLLSEFGGELAELLVGNYT